jgi:hypothetical protein
MPLVHDFLTNIADGIVVRAGSQAGYGNIVDRAAPGALKFIYGTLPRLIRHHANMRLRQTHARLNTVQWVWSLAAATRVVGNQVRSAVVSFLGTYDPLTLPRRHAGIHSRTHQCGDGTMANNPNQGGQQSQNPNQKPGQQGQDPIQKLGQQTQNPGQGGKAK